MNDFIGTIPEKRLHIGSGRAYLPGWTNVDLFSSTKADLYCDAMRLPFEKETFDEIYCCHCLEHFHRHAIVAVLHHWRELLKKGGILKLSVPDFGKIVEWYNRTGDLGSLIGLLYGGQNHPLNVHTIAFDGRTLTGALLMAGFTKTEHWDWRKTNHSLFDDYASARLPHMSDGPETLWMSLNLQAIK